MSKPLSVVIRADSTQLQADFSRANAMAKVFAAKVQRDMDLAAPSKDTIYSGTPRRMAEAAAARAAVNANVVNAGFTHGGISGRGERGRRANFAIAGSMFTSVARDSAASLASGAPITQVIAQQAPQVLQALAMMRLGLVAVGVVAAGAAAAGVFYMAKAWHDMFFEVKRTTDLNERIRVFGDNVKRLRDSAALSSSLEADEALATFNRTRETLREKEKLADAAADLEKEQARAHSFQTQTVRNAEVEKKLKEEILQIELKRARAALEAARNDPANADVLQAEAKLKQVQLEGDRVAAADSAKTDWRTTKLRGDELRAALKEQNDNQLQYNHKLREAEKELAAARAKTNQTEIIAAEAKVLGVQNQIDELATSREEKIKLGRGSRGAPDVTDRQRMNLMAVGNSPLLDVNRQQLKELQLIRQQMKGNNIDSAFGSP